MEPIQSDIFVCKGDLLIQTLSVSHFIISDGDCVLQKGQHGMLVGGRFCNMVFDVCYAKFYEAYSTEIHVNVYGRVADLFRTI